MSRDDRSNYRASVHIWAYQVINDDKAHGTSNFFMDFSRLRLETNTIKATLKEARMRFTCGSVRDATTIYEFNTDPATDKIEKYGVTFARFIEPTVIDFYDNQIKIDRISR
jgi:hypothetical protein